MSLAEQWQNEGYLIIRHVYDRDRTGRLLEICDNILAQWRVCNPENGKPGGGPDKTAMRHLNHPGYFREHPAWRPVLLDAIAAPEILDTVRTLFGEEPLFRCTSYFFNPSAGGGDGNWHRDSQFIAPDDEAEQKVLQDYLINGSGVQMQIALVPSADVEYVPGSHRRWDTPEEYRIRKADNEAHNTSNDMPGAVRADLRPGDAVLFNPMGLHRGRYHTDRLRRTLMLTYTKTSRRYYDYFSFQPWCLEPGYLDGVKDTTRAFFDAFIDLYAESWQQPSRQ
jgi:hypothetical protein